MSRRVHFGVVELEGRTTLRLEERMSGDAKGTVGVSAGAGGFVGVLGAIPLKVLVAKWILLLAWGPLVAVGATLGWLGGRALWRREAATREGALKVAFAEIVAVASARRRALPEG